MTHLSLNEKEPNGTAWPDFVKRGLEMLYGEYQSDQEMKEFIARWGGFDREALVRALAEGHGEDRLLAICLIAESGLPRGHHPVLCVKSRALPKKRN